MKERELGHMQIAGEKIRVVEKDADPDDPVLLEYVRLQERQVFSSSHVHELHYSVCDWWAYIDEKTIIASGSLLEMGDDAETVGAIVYVATQYRRLGIGRFMASLVTDQAIYYRKRTILAEVENTNEAALKILDEEEFEVQPEQHPGFTLLKKELKWT